MNHPLTVSALARSVWHDFLVARRELIIFEILFKLLEAWLLVPAVAMILALMLSRAGHIAVSNLDILDFLLTPLGLLYAGLFGTFSLALLLLEQAGIMILATHSDGVDRPHFKQLLGRAFPQVLRVTQMGAIMLTILATAAIPFLLMALLTYGILLSEHDIYYYLKVRPPNFWLAAGVGGVLLVGAFAVGAWLSIRWIFALPILLFEKQSVLSALRASRDRVRGVAWRVSFLLGGWLFGVLLIGIGLDVAFRLTAEAILESAGERPVAAILALLVVHGALAATWSFVLIVGLALASRQLYLFRNEQLDLIPPNGPQTPGTEKSVTPWNWRLAALCLPIFLVAPLVLWLNLWRYVTTTHPPAQVTAHRGNARAAPENTLSAIRKAIESGADYVEMDVQQTADGVVVLLHDRDLRRVSGVSRRLEELSFEEVRRLDVGSWFDPAFAGERVPTLEEVITLCRGRIKLNIELKFFGPDRKLAGEVARLVRDQHMEADCIITSLEYDALEEVKHHNPRLRTGLIVAHALGDVSRLEVDALSVRADFLSDGLLRSARRQGHEVLVWTVNDAGQMTQLIKRGVDNIITSDPDLAIRVRNEWANLSEAERLVLASRLLLGFRF